MPWPWICGTVCDKSASLASDNAGGTQSEYIQSDTDDWDGDADTTEKFCTFIKMLMIQSYQS